MKVLEMYRPKEVLYPRYYEVKKEVIGPLKGAILSKPIFWSNDRLTHWFFDFKFKDTWVSCHSINNELNEIKVILYNENEEKD